MVRDVRYFKIKLIVIKFIARAIIAFRLGKINPKKSNRVKLELQISAFMIRKRAKLYRVNFM